MTGNQSRSRCVAIALLVVAGCGRDAMSPEPHDAPHRVVGSLQQPRTVDEEWANLAAGPVPGFAGFFLDEGGQTVTLIAERGDPAAARTYVSDRLRAIGLSSGRISVRAALYDFAQLKRWHDAILHRMEDLPLRSLDIDERSNRIRIGVDQMSTGEALRRYAAQLGVPNNALIVEVAPEPQLRNNVRSIKRPVQGGYQMEPNVGNFCTLGFNARTSNGTRVLVIASHCTTQIYSDDYDAIFQNYDDPAGNLDIAGEIDDPPAAGRQSDSALYEYWVLDDFARIARTQSAGFGGRGSLWIDTLNPYWTVTSKITSGSVISGYWINKVGRTSGWTRGQVTQTCVTLPNIGVNLPCQYVAGLWSEPGDSGAPIFADQSQSATPSGWTVGLVGLLWGGPGTNYSVTWYSPIDNVEADLGTLFVCASLLC